MRSLSGSAQQVPDTRPEPEIFSNTRSKPELFSESSGISEGDQAGWDKIRGEYFYLSRVPGIGIIFFSVQKYSIWSVSETLFRAEIFILPLDKIPTLAEIFFEGSPYIF